MTVSPRQLVFLLGYSVISFLLLIFGNFYIKWYLLLVISIFLLLSDKFVSWEEVKKHWKIGLLWVIFLFGLLVASLFSHSLPLAIDNHSFFTICFVLFIFTLGQKKISVDWFLYILIIITITLVIMSAFAWTSDDFSTALPGMNLLYHSYGHNHLAALLLLIIPISWWFFIRKLVVTQSISIISLFPVVLFTGFLLISFGRVAILLGFLQLLAILFLLLTQKRSLNRIVRNLMALSLVSFTVILLFFLFFSLGGYLSGDHTCYFPSFRKQLCKPLNREFRPYYWGQALQATYDYPLFGYGPGSFGLINTRYRQRTDISTNFAHNSFLEMFSESGLIGGGLFLILMVVLLKRCLFVTKENIDLSNKNFIREKKSYIPFVFIGVLSSYINALFDFDWNFLGVFSILLILISLLLKEQKEIHKDVMKITDFLIKPVYYLSVSVIIVLSLLFFLVQVLIGFGSFDRAVKVFPYFHSHKKILLDSYNNLSPDSKNRLKKIYHFDSDLYFSLIKETPEEIQVEYKNQLRVIDPWQLYYNNNYEWYLSQEEYDLAYQERQEILHFLETKNKKTGFTVPYFYIDKIMKNSLQIANYFLYDKKDINKAKDIYSSVVTFDPWVISKVEPPIGADQSINETQMFLEIMMSLDDFDLNKVGQFQMQYTNAFYDVYLRKIVDFSNQEFPKKELQSLLILSPNNSNSLWKTTSQIFEDQVEQALTNNDETTVRLITDYWYQAWYIHKEFSQSSINDGYSENLATFLVKRANELASTDMKLATQYYKQAREVDSFVFLRESFWFEDQDDLTISHEDAITYFESFSYLKGAEIGWKSEQHADLLLKLILKAVEQSKLDFATKYISYYEMVDYHNYQTELTTVQRLQQRAIQLHEEDDSEEAIAALEIMTKIMPNDYWAQQQLGNYYMKLSYTTEKNKDLYFKMAKKEFEDCADLATTMHSCEENLQAIQDGSYDYMRYDQVAKMISE